MWRRRETPSFCRSTSLCAFAVLGEMPRRSPTSSLDSPAAMSSTTSRCLSVRFGSRSLSTWFMQATLAASWPLEHWPKGVFRGLLRRAYEADYVTASVCGGELLFAEGVEPAEKLELVSQVGAHHL